MLKPITKGPSILFLILFSVFGLTACTGTPSQSPQVPASGETAIVTQENPLAPETNPVGDIPDTQAFVNYVASPGNYSLDVPEGWARTNNGSDVRFVDKFDGVSVPWLKPHPHPPQTASNRMRLRLLPRPDMRSRLDK